MKKKLIEILEVSEGFSGWLPIEMKDIKTDSVFRWSNTEEVVWRYGIAVKDSYYQEDESCYGVECSDLENKQEAEEKYKENATT